MLANALMCSRIVLLYSGQSQVSLIEAAASLISIQSVTQGTSVSQVFLFLVVFWFIN